MKFNQLEEPTHYYLNQVIPHNFAFEGIDGGFDKKRTGEINLWQHVKIGDEQMLLFAQICDDQIEVTCASQMEIEQKQLQNGPINQLINQNSNQLSSESDNQENIIDYNIRLIEKSSKIQKRGKNRYPDIFLTRFRQAIKRKLEKGFKLKRKIKRKDLSKLPGMINPTMNNMIDLLEIKNLLSSKIPSKQVSQEYTSSNQILLDALFPLQTSTGDLRRTKVNKTSTYDLVRFFPSYEIISKSIDCQGVQRNDLTFQNCRHYNLLTNTKYNRFSKNK